MHDVRDDAERVLRDPGRLADLALAFDETVASTVDVQVEGPNCFPRPLTATALAAISPLL